MFVQMRAPPSTKLLQGTIRLFDSDVSRLPFVLRNVNYR